MQRFVCTFTGRAALIGSECRVGTGGHRTGDENTHLTPGVTVTVSAAIVPAVALLKPPPVSRQTDAGLLLFRI